MADSPVSGVVDQISIDDSPSTPSSNGARRPAVAPVATYRLQLTPTFGLDDAAAIVPYLAQLGISHVYCSPYLQAALGSTHGYDVTDHSRVNDELGGEPARRRLVDAIRANGLHQLIDIVPNHMSVADSSNRQWWDVLQHGRFSESAKFFDIDWPGGDASHGRVLIPVLGEHYGHEVTAGTIRLVRVEREVEVHYHEHRWPLSPASMAGITMQAAQVAIERIEPDHESQAADEANGIDEEWRRLDDALEQINADPVLLHDVLDQQHYLLASWRAARDDLDYRRFFDVDTLAGLRVEDEDVFAESHRLPLQWVRDGDVDGLRIDHPDGLRDPSGYLDRLADAAPGAWILVEKILEPGERMRPSWPVHGTTGYEFLNVLNGLFVDGRQEAVMTALWTDSTGRHEPFEDVARTAKSLVVREILAADVSRLTNLLLALTDSVLEMRGFTRRQVQIAVEEMVIAFPVYRTYTRPGLVHVDDQDVLTRATNDALLAAAQPEPELIQFIAAIVRRTVDHADADEIADRFQQLTGPAMAKGLEDTAFYRYLRLTSLNEVGGDPASFGVSVDEFHRHCSATAEHHPMTMLATSTHDTKRSEDVRVRIDLLSEMPERFASALDRWRGHADRVWDGVREPALDHLVFQTLVGTYPISAERMRTYLTKALREAKEWTTWVHPDEAGEERVHQSVERLLDDETFVADLTGFIGSLVMPARATAMSQLLLKLTAPGVPDLYQGTELWTDQLVDPDNRGAVDFGRRHDLLASIIGGEPCPRLDADREGVTKLWLVHRLLAVRRAHSGAFTGTEATYAPLSVEGPMADHALAFARGADVVVIAPRLLAGLLERGWEGSSVELPAGEWRDVLVTDEVATDRFSLDRLCPDLPMAVLVRIVAGEGAAAAHAQVSDEQLSTDEEEAA